MGQRLTSYHTNQEALPTSGYFSTITLFQAGSLMYEFSDE